jgi:HSP20 family protein
MKDVIRGLKGIGDLLQMVAPQLDGLYQASIKIGARTLPTTIPRAGSIPRAPRRRPDHGAAREPMVDLFDEDDKVIVVVQLPGVDQQAAQWSFPDSRHLTIQAASPDCEYLRKLGLPAAVDEQATTSSFANGVLELTLWKRR